MIPNAEAEPGAPPVALTVDQCAAQLQVSHDTVERWIRDGHLKAFVRPGLKPGQRRGRKTYRIWPEDWAAFCRRFTVTAGPAPEPPPRVVVGPTAAGTDGVSRRTRRRD